MYPFAWLTPAAHCTFAKPMLTKPVGPGLRWEADPIVCWLLETLWLRKVCTFATVTLFLTPKEVL